MVRSHEPRKVKFAAMKLTDQASQYWTNLVNLRIECDQEPIDKWGRMKEELKGKYVPSLSHAPSHEQVASIHPRQQIGKEVR